MGMTSSSATMTDAMTSTMMTLCEVSAISLMGFMRNTAPSFSPDSSSTGSATTTPRLPLNSVYSE